MSMSLRHRINVGLGVRRFVMDICVWFGVDISGCWVGVNISGLWNALNFQRLILLPKILNIRIVIFIIIIIIIIILRRALYNGLLWLIEKIFMVSLNRGFVYFNWIGFIFSNFRSIVLLL